MPTWIRCPHCDVAFQVRDESPGAEVRCDACGTRLGSCGESEVLVNRPLDVRQLSTLEGHAIEGHALEGHALEGHAREVGSVAFSPDGSTLASGSVDRTVKLWRLPRRMGRGEAGESS